MKITLLITAMLIFVVSCTNLPLHKVPLGANISSYILYERNQNIDYLSISQQGGPRVKLDDQPLYSPNISANNWKIFISKELKRISEVEVAESIGVWVSQYDQSMKILAPGIRHSSYEITIVPDTLTYRLRLRREYTNSLLPISFVIPVSADASTKVAFQRVFRTLSHEHLHIYHQLDAKAVPVDSISKETFATFVSSCLSNMLFEEFREPGKNVSSIGEYINSNHTRAELREAMAANAKTKDVIQSNLAGKLVVRYLFDIIMNQPSREASEFSEDLNKLCHAFGADTPVTWEGLLDLYSG